MTAAATDDAATARPWAPLVKYGRHESAGIGTSGWIPAPVDRIDARWAPIEIGKPILSFEPRPAPLDGMHYPADTVCDGWSTPDVTVRLASVRGYAHRYKGTPRQDDAVVAIHPATGAVVFAVADGVANSQLSHVGAAIACRSAVLSVLAGLDTAHLVDWSGALREVASRMTGYVADLFRQPVDTDTVGRLLATTLVLGIARPGADGVTATLVQIGDTSAWLLSRGSYQPILVEKTAAAATVVSSAVYALPSVPEHVTAVHVEIPANSVLLVGTDGFGDPLGDRTGEVADAFARALAVPPPPLGLAHLLDFSREMFDDDRTLLAIWPVGGR